MITTVLYVAASETAATDGAEALERAGSNLAVESAVEVAKVRTYAPGVDCVVFAETPTTPEGAHLLEVVDACGETPVVLYADGTFGPSAARSTDGVDGYVRREGDGSVAHLADEIAWVCHALNDSGSDGGVSVDRLRELATRIGACRSEPVDLEAAVEPIEDVLEASDWAIFRCERRADGDRLVPTTGSSDEGHERRADEGVAGTALQAGRTCHVEDDDVAALDGDDSHRSAIAVPIGSFGVFLATDERAAAFDEADRVLVELLVAHVHAVLTRLRVEARLRERGERVATLEETVSGLEDAASRHTAERDRLEETVARLEETVTRLERDVSRLTAERDRLEEALAVRDARLEALAELVDEELRRPLNVARAYLELVTATDDPEHFAEIEDAHEQLCAHLDHLQALARGEDGDDLEDTQPKREFVFGRK